MEKREKFLFNDIKMFSIKAFDICVNSIYRTLVEDENCKHSMILYPKQSDFCESSKNEKDLFKIFLMRYKDDEDPDVIGLTHCKKERNYTINAILGKDKKYAIIAVVDYSEENRIGTSLFIASASHEDGLRILDNDEFVEDTYAKRAYENIKKDFEEFSESFVFIK